MDMKGSMHHHANFCLSLFSAIHLARKITSRMKHPPPRARKAIPKKRSLFPT
jgi:hypothetical protein